MKKNEIVDHRGIGTIQMRVDEDGRKFYTYKGNFFNQPGDEDTIKGAKEMLEWEYGKAVEIQRAIDILTARGYKVYKEIA